MKPYLLALSMLSVLMFAVVDVSADEMLVAARQASIASREELQSVQSSGSFTVHRRDLADQEETLWTDGSFDLSYDCGKYYLDIKFRKCLSHLTYPDTEEQTITKVVDFAPDRVVIVCDGKMAFVVTFSARINRTGCQIEKFSSMESAISCSRFPLHIPEKPWLKVLNVDALIENLGADRFTLSRLDSGIVRGTYDLNSSNSYVEFDIDPRSGNHVIAKRSFTRPSKEPVSTKQLTWKQKDGVWFVARFETSHKYRLTGMPPLRERTVVTYDSFAPNKPIDKKLFAIQSLPIPIGTRTLDQTR